MKHRIVNRMPLAAALAGIILAFAGVAHAGAVSTARSEKLQKAKMGTLKITVATDVGGVTLERGDYEVKQANSTAGPVVRFTRVTYNPWASEGSPVYEWETVAEVRVTMQSLASKAAHTQLLVASNGDRPIGLEIRGSSYDYMF